MPRWNASDSNDSTMSLYDRIMTRIAGASADKESESERDGLLSYANEWHALIVGLGLGVTAGLANMPSLAYGGVALALGIQGVSKAKLSSRKSIREFTSEPWYGAGGVLIGWVGSGGAFDALASVPL